MIIMPVPKDIRSIKSKFIGPFTKRQAMAVIPAGVIAAMLFFLLGDFIPSESLMGLIILIDLPIIACGFIDVYGMPLWVYAKNIAICKFLAPKHRPYVTENTYEEFAKQNRITYEFFDGDTEEYTAKQMKKREKLKKKRLERFLKENPDLNPIK